MKTFTIDVDTEGNAKMEANGFKGKACEKMQDFEKEMGDVKKRTNKPEMYQTDSTTNKQTV